MKDLRLVSAAAKGFGPPVHAPDFCPIVDSSRLMFTHKQIAGRSSSEMGKVPAE
jgi:hypothetical protein